MARNELALEDGAAARVVNSWMVELTKVLRFLTSAATLEMEDD